MLLFLTTLGSKGAAGGSSSTRSVSTYMCALLIPFDVLDVPKRLELFEIDTSSDLTGHGESCERL